MQAYYIEAYVKQIFVVVDNVAYIVCNNSLNKLYTSLSEWI